MAEIWERQVGEPIRWFARFEKYRLLGPTRTPTIVYNGEREADGRSIIPWRHAPASWYTNSRKWCWDERAEAWDISLIEENNREWLRRREEWRQQEWDLAEAMHKKVLDMMVFPVTRVTREQDGRVTVIEPADWKIADISKMATVISKLARLATGMATDRTEAIEFDPNQFTDEELEEIEATGDVKAVLEGRKQGQGEGEGSASAPLQLPEA